MHDKFQSCTLGVKAAKMIYNNPKAYLGVCVQCMLTPTHFFYRQPLPHVVVGIQSVSLYQYTPHHVSNVHNKFKSCTVGEKASTMIYNNHSADLGVCLHAQCMPLRFV